MSRSPELHALMKPLSEVAAGTRPALMLGDGADVMPIWPVDDAFAARWVVAEGGDIKNMIAVQISAMQSIQTVQN